MAAQLASQSLRFGWYFALQRLMDRRTAEIGGAHPSTADAAGALHAGIAGRPRPPAGNMAVRYAHHPPWTMKARRRSGICSRAALFADLPDTIGRRASKDATRPREEAVWPADYYAQDFHFRPAVI